MNIFNTSKKKSKSGSGSGSGSGSRSGHSSGSKSGSKGGSKSSSKDSNADSNADEWGDWEWDAQWQRNWRSRETPDGEWEYQYRYPDGDDVPRTPNLNSIDEDPRDDTQYTQALAEPPPSGGQLLPTSGIGVDAALGYSFKPMPSPGALLTRAVGNLRLDSDVSHNDTLDYEETTRNELGNEDSAMVSPQTGGQGTANYWGPSTTPSFPYSTPALPYPTPPRAPQSFAPSYPQPGLTNEPSTGYAPGEDEPQLKYKKPAGSVESNRYISASPKEPLHKDYKVHHARDFQFGRVFKILWTEPKGQGQATKGTDRQEGVTFPTTYKEDAYSSIRRFVIFNANQGHCLCLPILTYQGQATTKRGVKPQDHAIIYTKEKGRKTKTPKEIDGEVKLEKKAIRVTPNSPREQLDKLSRLNYAKIYTVEYNVKVHFIGQIHEKSIKYFTRDYNAMHLPLPEADDVEYSDDESEEQ